MPNKMTSNQEDFRAQDCEETIRDTLSYCISIAIHYPRKIEHWTHTILIKLLQCCCTWTINSHPSPWTAPIAFTGPLTKQVVISVINWPVQFCIGTLHTSDGVEKILSISAPEKQHSQSGTQTFGNKTARSVRSCTSKLCQKRLWH